MPARSIERRRLRGRRVDDASRFHCCSARCLPTSTNKDGDKLRRDANQGGKETGEARSPTPTRRQCAEPRVASAESVRSEQNSPCTPCSSV